MVSGWVEGVENGAGKELKNPFRISSQALTQRFLKLTIDSA